MEQHHQKFTILVNNVPVDQQPYQNQLCFKNKSNSSYDKGASIDLSPNTNNHIFKKANSLEINNSHVINKSLEINNSLVINNSAVMNKSAVKNRVQNQSNVIKTKKFSEKMQQLDDSFSSIQLFQNQNDEKFLNQIDEEFDIIKNASQSQDKKMFGDIARKQNNLRKMLEQKNSNLNIVLEKKDELKQNDSQKQPHMMITDIAMHFDDLDDLDIYYRINNSSEISILDRIKYWMQQNNIDLYFLLIVLGISVSSLSVAIDFAIEKFMSRMYLLLISKQQIDIFYCCIQGIVCATIAVFITLKFPNIEGSGIPETKSVISGISIYKYMSFKTLLFKCIALIFAMGAGYFVGKEGPFVHISACIGNNLSKMPIFRRLYKKQTFRKQLLTIAAGVGVTATFGTPIGGCLYSIETVISHFQVSHIWKSFICSFVAGIWLYYLNDQLDINIYARTYMDQIELNTTEILLLVLFGILVGLVASIFIWLLTKIVKLKQYLFKHQIMGPYSYSLTVISLHLIFYQYSNFGFNRYSLKAIFDQTTFKEFGSDIQQSFSKLCIVTFLRIILHILALTSSIPSGNLIPLFFLGGLLGRIYSKLANLLGSNLPSSCYAVIGAASLVSSATHTILAIIVLTFEFTFQIKVLFPLMISIVTAYSVSNYFQTSLYHLLIDIKQLPLLPRLLNPSFFNKVSHDIMDSDIDFLHLNSTMSEIAVILNRTKYKIGCIPVVNNPYQLNLVGSIQCNNLSGYLYKQFSSFKNQQIEQINNGLEMVDVADEIGCQHQIKNHQFWNQRIDINDTGLFVDKSPFTIQSDMPVVRLHFIFLMLGLQYAFVTSQGQLLGIIQINSFQ